MNRKRRYLLLGAGSALALSAFGASAAALAPTPRQTRGPFYPPDPPLDADSDLVHVDGHPRRARGTVADVTGRIVDPSGAPIDAARVEIWQCDANGRYHHPRAPADGRDPGFQGFGTATTDADGCYRFRTIRPVPYPGRTPHIHFRVVAPEFPELVTQMYIAGHPMNAGDAIFRRAGAARERLAVAFESAADPAIRQRARFDLVIAPA